MFQGNPAVFLQRPITILFLAATALLFALPAIREYGNRRRQARTPQPDAA